MTALNKHEPKLLIKLLGHGDSQISNGVIVDKTGRLPRHKVVSPYLNLHSGVTPESFAAKVSILAAYGILVTIYERVSVLEPERDI